MTTAVEQRFTVVVNDEEQYSIWEVGRPVPAGWNEVGVAGTKQECLDHIEQAWTDLRPRSVREHLARLHADPAGFAPVEPDPADEPVPDLPARLATAQLVQAVCRPESATGPFLSRMDAGFVHILFPGTRGGTELGITVDPDASDWSRADPARTTGTVRVVGDVVLDFQPLRCVAEIDLASLSGQGWVEPATAGVA
jgi:uncharacterized protein YbdZ (MbtH family)